MTFSTRSNFSLPTVLALAAAFALLPATAPAAPDPREESTAAQQKRAGVQKKRSAGGAVHKGNYTCYQGGLTSTGSVYWGWMKVKRGNRYEIPGSSGKLKRKGKKLVFLSGSLKRWKYKGRYRTSRTAAGKKQWHIDLIDRPNRIKIQCHDGGD